MGLCFGCVFLFSTPPLVSACLLPFVCVESVVFACEESMFTVLFSIITDVFVGARALSISLFRSHTHHHYQRGGGGGTLSRHGVCFAVCTLLIDGTVLFDEVVYFPTNCGGLLFTLWLLR